MIKKAFKHTKKSIELMKKKRAERIVQPNQGNHYSEVTKEKMRKTQTERLGNLPIGHRVTQNKYFIVKCILSDTERIGYRLAHRVIVEEVIGRKLSKEEIIHHIDGNKKDNRPKNLYVFTSHSEHRLYEANKNKKLLKSNLNELRKQTKIKYKNCLEFIEQVNGTEVMLTIVR